MAIIYSSFGKNDATILVIVASILAIALIAYLLLVAYVKKHSSALKSLALLNDAYTHKFHYDIQEEYYTEKVYKSKGALDAADMNRLMYYHIESYENSYRTYVKKAKENITVYTFYSKECDLIFSNRNTDWYKLFNYTKIERRLFCKACISPVMDVGVLLTASYRSPKGKNYYERKHKVTMRTVEHILAQIENKHKYHASKEYERSKMTPSLRYDVLKRDHFTCVLCGATAREGAKLHVDHIVPISRGGKTEFENLRTLCESCNLGKSDKYDEKGFN